MDCEYILAHDIGTSGTKTSVFGQDGVLIDSRTTPHRTYQGTAGEAEQDPEDWWQGVCLNTRELVEKHPDIRSRICAAGVSGIMLGCLPVDSEGIPLRRCMIHSDNRAKNQCKNLCSTAGEGAVYDLTGNVADPRSSLCKAMWIREIEPSIYRRTALFLQAKDYITGRMTGNMNTTDYSDASHAQFINIFKKEYDASLIKEAGLDLDKLPDIRRSTETVGVLSAESARQMGLSDGIPVIAGGGDGACANIGAGVTVPGQIYCCLGTTAWIAALSERPVIDPGRRLFNILSLDGANCGYYGTVQSACRSVQWAMELFDEKDVEKFHKYAGRASAGCDGLIFLPYIEGERSPVFDPDARGVFCGIASGHQKRHFMRSVLEGVAFALRSVLYVFSETCSTESMRLIGGGARSQLWRQIIADICSTRIRNVSIPSEHATSFGIAAAAGVAAGMFTSLEEAVSCIGPGKTTEPEPGNRELYDAMYQVYSKLYPGFKSSFHDAIKYSN